MTSISAADADGRLPGPPRGVRGAAPRVRARGVRGPRLSHGRGRPRRTRALVRAAARVRLGAARAHARPRDRDAWQETRAQARSTRTRVAPARRVSARV